MARNYAREAKWESSPKQVANRVARNKARREMIAAGRAHKGDGMDVDHKKPLVKGGSKAVSNLRVIPKSQNRSFARTKKAGMK